MCVCVCVCVTAVVTLRVKSTVRLLFGSLVWFYGISTIEGYLMPNLVLYIEQFYFKQFTLA